MSKQLSTCSKKSPVVFEKHKADIWVESNIKFANENIKVKLSELTKLSEDVKSKKDVQCFHIKLNKTLGSKFANPKKVIEFMESMILDYYEGVVQHVVSWKKPAPKIVEVAALVVIYV